MKAAKKVIITCAPTGSIYTPSMSPHLPITPDEIAASATAAAEAGASIIHLHARNPDGSPSPSAGEFMKFLPRIKQSTDAVINITTGGSHTMTLDERMEAAKAAQPEVCSLNMGPLIFDYSAAGKRVQTWKYDWEKPYVEGSYDRVMYNTNFYIERICARSAMPMARASNSSATISVISIRLLISPIADWRSRRSLCRAYSGSWVVSAPMSATWRTW